MTELSKLFANKPTDEESWISTSDMMTGLMMIFLFISIIYIAKVKSIVGEVEDTQDIICSELKEEFSSEQAKWNMQICEEGLVVRFTNEGFFLAGKSDLTPQFKELLSEFYPRFKNILWKYIEDISELRIEGHASSEANINGGKLAKYLFNTELSQDRSYEVMNFVLNLNKIKINSNYLDWSFNHLTAHGMSSSVPVLLKGQEDKKLSRRVEFRIKTEAQDALLDIVRALDGT